MRDILFCVFKCVAVRNDGSRLERILRLPADWDCKHLSFLLALTIDKYELLDEIVISSECGEMILDINNHKCNMSDFSLLELKEPNISIVLKYKDNICVNFNCRRLKIEKSKEVSMSIHSIKGYRRDIANEEEVRYINNIAWNPEIKRLYELYLPEFYFNL